MTSVTFSKATTVGGLRSAIPTVRSSTYLTAVDPATLTAAQIVQGVVYNGAGNGTLTTPTAAAIVAYIAGSGVTPTVGMSLPPILVEDNNVNNLVVTAGVGVTLAGTAAILDQTALVFTVLTNVTAGAEAALCLIVKAT